MRIQLPLINDNERDYLVLEQVLREIKELQARTNRKSVIREVAIWFCVLIAMSSLSGLLGFALWSTTNNQSETIEGK